MTEFAGKGVVVTGGAKGIGRGICEAFAIQGAAVLCLDIDERAGEDLAREFERVAFFRADVSRSAECEADDICVLAVNPGTVDTPMTRGEMAGMSPEEEARAWDAMARVHPIGRVGCPADIANLVLFLASDRAAFMTGGGIDCDGGLMAQGAWAGAEEDGAA